ncbi:MAG: carbohydrate porin [Candidatus Omnitrophota bacterium]|nr:carbohydrate porin [Candidatus Omnitrophota bacterium]
MKRIIIMGLLLTGSIFFRQDFVSAVEIGGIEIGAGATFIVQGSIDANVEDAVDATISVDLEFKKKFDDFGLAFIHLEAGNGAGLDGGEVILFSGVNADATAGDSRINLIEAYYEHYLFEERFTITFGKLDPTAYLDDNLAANDECSQFIGSTFKNSAVLEFPDDTGPGIRVAIVPIEWIELNTGILDDNADWEDIADDIFGFFQINLKPNLLFDWELEGNYRVYAWYDNADHTELLDAAKDRESNYGAGLSFDQQLTSIIIAFSRFGWQNPKVSNIEYAWSAGTQISGKPWGRVNDVFGIAVGQNIPGDDYKRAGNPGHDEGHVEVYYNIYINDYLSISPDVQVIWNPNGVKYSSEGRNDTIIISGLRAQVDF